MQANWSLILNIILLVGVFFAIAHILRGRRQSRKSEAHKPSLGAVGSFEAPDDIVAVRKITINEEDEGPETPKISATTNENEIEESVGNDSIMVFLLAKDQNELAGYELLQTILAAGLRFGEGHLFHRHQHPNGQGPVMCSLAAATPTGVFDLQNIGAFSVRGLCLFMHASGNPTIDKERFTILLDTAKQLNEDLDTVLLDDKQHPFNETSLQRYYDYLNITDFKD